ncbi:molybdopterin biosynthesis MoeB protein [Geobacillus genomosp. 3]|uniref:Molybdopterin biosynthesis MoeB protein n=1 Tax=Geobacillus genomosp. 3 TaxID=1921421 RepID=S5Z098_GEOG3|nr:rhodanese-like domain-containing protein [Geobacillus genomosp. 3]AGT32374.1 molybdopterin biosynthesis MoeB protein [Geobacillus genomosp. 3]
MKTITPKEVEERLRAGEALHIIDVREPDEVAAGKIPGAVNIPLGLIEFRMHELDKNEEYILVCRSGGRSGRAAEFLDRRGYRVINMTGGMLAWEGPIESTIKEGTCQ